MSTQVASPSDIKKNWYVIDLDGQVLGRAAARIAHVLRGKHKPIYSPSVDAGDFVIVLNADKVALTGNKIGGQDVSSAFRFSGWIEIDCRRKTS